MSLVKKGMRVVGDPRHLPTQKGYFGCRRGVVVSLTGIGVEVEFDLIGRERKKKRKNLPIDWFVQEATFNKWVEEKHIEDPYG